MLSGESAKGRYPVISVQMMNKIVLNTEQFTSTHGENVLAKPSGNMSEALGSAGIILRLILSTYIYYFLCYYSCRSIS
jgi:pyruvate kinase